MKISKKFERQIIETAEKKNMSIYDIHIKYNIPTVALSKIFNGYLPQVSEKNQEKLKNFIENKEEALKENTDQKLKRQLNKLLEVFETRINIAKHMGVGDSLLTKAMSGTRPITSKRLIERTNEVFKDLEKNNFSLGEFNIEEYMRTHAYSKKVEKAERVDTKRLALKDRERALKTNRNLYKALKEGGAYQVSIDKYDDSPEQEIFTIIILEEYKKFYLGADKRGTKVTILKNNLYLSTTKVKKLN